MTNSSSQLFMWTLSSSPLLVCGVCYDVWSDVEPHPRAPVCPQEPSERTSGRTLSQFPELCSFLHFSLFIYVFLRGSRGVFDQFQCFSG